MKLSQVKLNQKVVVQKLNLKADVKNRLISLGICENKEIIVEKTSFLGGTLLVKVGDIRIIMQKSIAERIITTGGEND